MLSLFVSAPGFQAAAGGLRMAATQQQSVSMMASKQVSSVDGGNPASLLRCRRPATLWRGYLAALARWR